MSLFFMASSEMSISQCLRDPLLQQAIRLVSLSHAPYRVSALHLAEIEVRHGIGCYGDQASMPRRAARHWSD